jgi:uncharacterized phiE125 gp8 family phage protein
MIRNIATSYKVITQPATEVVATDVMKNNLKLDGITADDSLVATLLIAARQRCEEYCNIKFIDTVIEQVWDEFPRGAKFQNCLNLTIGNASAVESFKYYDEAGEIQTWSASNYILDTYSKSGRICTAANVDYPTIDTDRINAIVVRYTSGFGSSASTVPDAIKHAIMLQASYLYSNREDKAHTMSTLSEYLLNAYVVNPL